MPLQAYQAYQIDPEETEQTDISGVRLSPRAQVCPDWDAAQARGLEIGRALHRAFELGLRAGRDVETASACAALRRQARARRAIGALVGLAFFAAAPVTGWLASIA